MAKKRVLGKKQSLYLSAEMWGLDLQDAARNQRNPNDVIREAVRLLLDNQAEVIGSKRHFQKTLQERMDAFEAHITQQMDVAQDLLVFYQHVLLHLLAISAAAQLTRLGSIAIQPGQLLERALIAAASQRNLMAAQVQAAYLAPAEGEHRP